MTLITFTSDFGLSDHYVAFTKAGILKEYPEAQIVDISHQVKPFDLAHMSHILHGTFREFPAGTVHLIGNESTQKPPSYIIAAIEEHLFVGANNGVMSLVSEKAPTEVYEISLESGEGFSKLSAIVAKLAKGDSAGSFGGPCENFVQYMPRKARATKKEIAGHVIHVDHYGNLITNIEKTDFDILSRNRSYRITFGRDAVTEVNAQISEVEAGEVFFTFSSNGRLMLGINQGHGAQLLGLEYDSPVIIHFED
ncbi:S-adenosyl-l-methionine hydroxide adenosyltransferase family protein [Roseivirga sp. E12]|uniref:SAM hydrolase/SAM-dependent halogenase family protein n=1 Tax=Roseivirga sp. E12 TaxID=2819237 RepID=UPI001ABC534B|nr:SAM-dependent chlorinase/fluorinase [Roseivirga sp. E12]MBO3700199.1 SAM-dependent chlorinase/fluorinase [Roseivirga sp. E12]